MKSYTDIEQSKKLAEILPLESADYHYIAQGEESYIYPYSLSSDAIEQYKNIKYIPCWSLTALFDILPKYISGSVLRMDMSENDFTLWFDDLSGIVDENLPDITKDNPIDACYEMILKLHEQKLL
jgi:hypothetical protein